MTTKDTERIYPMYLQLEPKSQGIIIGVGETVNEDLYNSIIKNNGLATENNKGKVELGYTANSGVSVRMAFSNPKLFKDGIYEMMDIATNIVKHGVKEDAGFSDKPRVDLQNSLKSIELILDDKIIDDNRKLTQFPYTRLSMRLKEPNVLRAYKNTFLIPDGYSAEVN